MPIYKCRNCGNEYKQEASPSTCEVKPSCLGTVFFVDFSSYTQLVRANSELKIKKNQLENKINKINTNEINKSNQALKKCLKISISVSTFLCLGIIGEGYWAYQKTQEITQYNQSLSFQKNQLESDKSSLENKINILQTNYYIAEFT